VDSTMTDSESIRAWDTVSVEMVAPGDSFRHRSQLE
jgi:hypothetical protein